MNKFEHDFGEMTFELPNVNPDQGHTGNRKIFDPARTMSEGEAAKKVESYQRFVQPVDLPRHLFIPDGAESIDQRDVWNIVPATVDFEIFRFVAPEGSITKFISYGVFNDGLLAADYNFKPLVNGNRILRYHGERLADSYYRISLGLGADLSAACMIGCNIELQPGDVLQWLVTNNSAVDTSMGIRMSGYFDTQQRRATPKFG
jgi:hypothetical protein